MEYDDQAFLSVNFCCSSGRLEDPYREPGKEMILKPSN